MLLWLAALALADPCPDPAGEVSAANLAFEDAEVDAAQAHIDAALAGLTCGATPVDAALLQDLYGLDAVVAFTLADQTRTDAALARLRTAFPSAAPHAMFGPDLTALSDSWADRLGAPSVRVTLADGARAWIDGASLAPGETLRVVSGEHLLQGQGTTAFLSAWQAVSAPSAIRLGETLSVGIPPAAPPDVTRNSPPPATRHRKRRYRGGLLAISAVSAVAGGATLGYGWTRERAFTENAFLAPTYGGCAQADPCYDGARVDAIRADALNVRILYGVGYGLTALGVTLMGAELFVLPAPTAHTAVIGLNGSW